MTSEIRKELNRAKQLYKAGKRQEAFEIYNRLFMENPDEFKRWDKLRYCWTIYYLFIKDQSDETELMEYAEFVTDLVRQQNLKKEPVCVYTQTVFKVIMFLKARDDWDYMIYWLDKLKPELLSETQNTSGDRTFPSKKEDYYKYLSKAYLKCGDYEDCIRTSKKALRTIKVEFAFDGNIWHMWNIAKSEMHLGFYEDALLYFKRVIMVRRDWFILKDMAECSHQILEDGDALMYAREAILTDGSVKDKVNLYCVAYKILKEYDEEMALKHAKLCLALKLESGAQVPDEIDALNIDEDELDIQALASEINEYWTGMGGD